MKTANFITSLLIVMLITSALLLTGCQTSTIIRSLEATVVAAEVAIPVIGSATGLPAAVQTEIFMYLRAVNTATTLAASILAAPGDARGKSARILEVFQAIADGVKLPPGTPAEVQAVLTGVMQAVATFLTGLQQPQPGPVKLAFSGREQSKLQTLKARSMESLGKLEALRRR